VTGTGHPPTADRPSPHDDHAVGVGRVRAPFVSIPPLVRRLTTEFVGTTFLVAGVVGSGIGVVRAARGAVVAVAVAGYIAGAYYFTSSTSFANPAVAMGRAFSDTFAGIEPASVPMFIVAQLAGAVLAIGLILVIYPHVTQVAGDVLVPHDGEESPNGA
jgi:glycerol uptake facilitator-like aquaporin